MRHIDCVLNYFVSLVTFPYMYEQNVSCPKILVSYISYFDDINKIGLAIEQTSVETRNLHYNRQ